jgi:hypothetical protein
LRRFAARSTGPLDMDDVTIRFRADGVVELAPRIAPLPPSDRMLVIVTVVLVAAGFFVCGAMPAEALAAIIASALAGEIVLGVKALVLAVSRPRARVHEVPRARLRRLRR